jgi:ATP-dependent RNA helicase DDX3X
VEQEGPVRIVPLRTFKDAALHPIMAENIKLMGYDAPTPIQKYTIPSMLQGHDVIGIAQTGMIQNFFTCVNCQMIIDVA